jgi:Flp pilus assembly protein TadD
MTSQSTPFALRLTWARNLYDRGDFAAAARELADLVEEAEQDGTLHGTSEVRLLLARAYFRSAQLGRAERTLRRLVDEAPDDGYAHLLLGRTLQRQARHDDARHHLALAEILGDYERPGAYGERSGERSGERAG